MFAGFSPARSAAWKFPATSVTRAERERAEALLPDDDAEEEAATWAVAVMELGALVCTAANPRCEACPINQLCAWNTAGRPAYDGPPRRGQAWAGTDRQVRGRLMAVLRDTEGSVTRARLDGVWPDETQRNRALASLLTDGLVVETHEAGSPAAPSRDKRTTNEPHHFAEASHDEGPKRAEASQMNIHLRRLSVVQLFIRDASALF